MGTGSAKLRTSASGRYEIRIGCLGAYLGEAVAPRYQAWGASGTFRKRILFLAHYQARDFWEFKSVNILKIFGVDAPFVISLHFTCV